MARIESKQEAIKRCQKKGTKLYSMSIDRYVPDLGIHDQDWQWYLYDDWYDLKRRMHGIMTDIREYPDFQEFDKIENENMIMWDISYTCQYTGNTVRFVFLAEPVS